MSETRVIKKYPNRRLYDTEISRYITLEEVRQLVIQNVRFKVLDKRSKEDITRSILLQVIAEQEEGGNPIFRSELLTHIIRFYGDPLQSTMGRYLELSMQMFLDQQHKFTEQLKQLLGQAQQPIQVLREIAEDQIPIWRSVRREFLRNITRARGGLRGRRAGTSGVKADFSE